MKKTFLGFLILIISLISFVSKAQTINHSTIDKVGVTYKLIPSATGGASATGCTSATSTTSIAPVTPTINVRSNVNIDLKATQNPSKIHLKILNETGTTILYQVNYLLSSAPVINADGIKLFEKIGNKVKIINPSTVSLKHYKYELFTEDSNGAFSELFTITK